MDTAPLARAVLPSSTMRSTMPFTPLPARTFGLGLLLVGLATIPACHTYTAQDLRIVHDSPAAMRRRVGCFDVAVVTRTHPRIPRTMPIVDTWFYDACAEDPAWIDLGKLDVEAQWGDGAPRRLPAYDPEHRIAAGLVEPLELHHEGIAYRDPVQTTPPDRVCVGLGAIARDGDAASRVPVCFVRVGDDLVVEVR